MHVVHSFGMFYSISILSSQNYTNVVSVMPVSEAQKLAAGEVVVAICAAYAAGRGRRRLATSFVELVDKEVWPEYYEVCDNDSCSKVNVALMFFVFFP